MDTIECSRCSLSSLKMITMMMFNFSSFFFSLPPPLFPFAICLFLCLITSEQLSIESQSINYFRLSYFYCHFSLIHNSIFLRFLVAYSEEQKFLVFHSVLFALCRTFYLLIFFCSFGCFLVSGKSAAKRSINRKIKAFAFCKLQHVMLLCTTIWQIKTF